jgi:hypothetical protein
VSGVSEISYRGVGAGMHGGGANGTEEDVVCGSKALARVDGQDGKAG